MGRCTRCGSASAAAHGNARGNGGAATATLLGESPGLRRLQDAIALVAPTQATVLITGESGTGKELVARAVHEASTRSRRPFIAVNCSALPESLLESTLFGHVKGSFTGAVATRRGLFEEVDGGTLFLDEASTMPPSLQASLLRVLEERAVQRVGSARPVSVDFRLIAATNSDLAEEVKGGAFRQDLFFRLNVFPIHIPPLRERRGDVPLLARHFVRRFARESHLPVPEIPADTMARLMAYDWPGNVRELENHIERAVILCGSSPSCFEPPRHGLSPCPESTLRRAVEDGWTLARLEQEYIQAVLERVEGHQSNAAQILGIDRRTLYRKLKDDPLG